MTVKVQGHCPFGCGETLFVGEGGYITCSKLLCPHPDGLATILGQAETEHIVDVGQTSFAIVHPLRERLDNRMLRCPLHEHMRRLDGPPARPGRYRARRNGDDGWWSWELLDAGEPRHG